MSQEHQGGEQSVAVAASVEKWQALFVRQQEVTHWLAYIFLLVQALFVPAYVQAKGIALPYVVAGFACLHAVIWLGAGRRTAFRTARIFGKIIDLEKQAPELSVYTEMAEWDVNAKPVVRELPLLNTVLPVVWIVFWAIIVGVRVLESATYARSNLARQLNHAIQQTSASRVVCVVDLTLLCLPTDRCLAGTVNLRLRPIRLSTDRCAESVSKGGDDTAVCCGYATWKT